MKKKYISPESKIVDLMLHGSILNEGAIGGQSYTTVGDKNTDRDGISWGARGQNFVDDDDSQENDGKSNPFDLWD